MMQLMVKPANWIWHTVTIETNLCVILLNLDGALCLVKIWFPQIVLFSPIL